MWWEIVIVVIFIIYGIGFIWDALCLSSYKYQGMSKYTKFLWCLTWPADLCCAIRDYKLTKR